MKLARFDDASPSEWRAYLHPIADHLPSFLPAMRIVARGHEVPSAGAQDAVAVDRNGACVLLTCCERSVARVPDELTTRWAWFHRHTETLRTRFPGAAFGEAPEVRAMLLAPGFSPRLIRALESSPIGDLQLVRVRVIRTDRGDGFLLEDALDPGARVAGTRPVEPRPPVTGTPESLPPEVRKSEARAPDEARATPPPAVTAFRPLRPLGTSELLARCAHHFRRLDPALMEQHDGDTTRFVLGLQTVATLLERADHLELAVPGHPPFSLRAADDLEQALLAATRRYFGLLGPARRRVSRRGLTVSDLLDDE